MTGTRQSDTGRLLLSMLPLFLALTGCSGSNGDKTEEQRALERMNIARALEADSLRFAAAVEYAIVANIYPSTQYFDTAVRKAALLFCDPHNETRSDSTIQHWFGQYRKLSLSDEERALLESHILLMEELRETRGELDAERARGDSLSFVATKRESDLESSERSSRDRLMRLERELLETRKELEKLREIDIKMGREKQDEN